MYQLTMVILHQTLVPALCRKILLNVADADLKLSTDFPDAEAGHVASELDDNASIPSKTLPILPDVVPSEDANPPLTASDGQIYYTALGPPPLHHRGVVRSVVLFVPDDAPGICP